MREIKCRGYNKDSKRWITGSYVDGYIINGVVEANEEYISIAHWAPVEKESVGQCTGLKDGYGVEICEGDVIQGTMDDDPLTIIVKWFDLRAGFNLMGLNTDAFKIIGNIYENPVLIKGD